MLRTWSRLLAQSRSLRRRARERSESLRRFRLARVELLEGRALLAVGDLLDVRQFGTSGSDEVSGQAWMNGYRYVAGFTTAALPGQTALGGAYDGFLRKYDDRGEVLWTRQFGTSGTDYVYDMTAAEGAIYVVGFIEFAAFPGQSIVGGGDAFLRKYDTDGNELWTRQFGSTAYESATTVAVDSTGIYVGGETSGVFPGQTSSSSVDAWLRKYDFSGNVAWTHQFGTDGHDSLFGITPHSSGLYVTGRVGNGTNGAFPGFSNPGDFDGFVRKYTLNGSGGNGVPVWTQQFGTSGRDEMRRAEVDASGVYVIGGVTGTLPGAAGSGGKDVVIRKYDHSGASQWVRQFGSTGTEEGYDLEWNGSELIATATTSGAMPGHVSAGLIDIVLIRLDSSGNEIQTRQFGSTGNDYARAFSLRGDRIYLAGGAEGALPGGGSALGGADAFIATLDAGPAEGDFIWKRTIGTSGTDEIEASYAVGQFVYEAGGTTGALPSFSNAGDRDAFLRKYDSTGATVWTTQFGTSGFDRITGVVADANSIYVAGHTFGSFPGFTNAGAYDGFLRKYDTSGTLLWTRQFGSSGTELAGPIGMDATGVYVSGETTATMPGQTSAGGSDVFVVKYGFDGTPLWTRQFGTTATDQPGPLGADSTGVYVLGLVGAALPGQTSLGGNDAFVRKLDPAGNELWTTQFGSAANDSAGGFANDETGVYIGGSTSGALPGNSSAGGVDSFIRKLSVSGSTIWTRQFGTAGDDSGRLAIAPDGVYAALGTTGVFAGLTSSGGRDVALLEFDRSGVERSRRQFGTTQDDFVATVSTTTDGPVVAFASSGALAGQLSAGGFDTIVMAVRSARTVTWINPAGGDWHTAANWDLGVVPSDGDQVVIPDLGASGPNLTITYSTGSTTLASLSRAENVVVAGGTLRVDSANASAGDWQVTGGTLRVDDRLLGRPAQGVVGYWPGEGVALDAGGTAHGALANGATYASGRIGQAFSFDGVNDQLNAPLASSLNGSFTIAMWVNPTSIATSPIVFEKGTSVANRIGLQITSDGRVGGYFDGGSYSVVSPPGLVAPNQFSHVAFVFDDAANVASVYVDGALVANGLEIRTPLGNSAPAIFGRQDPAIGALALAGRIDEPYIFSRALSANELAAMISPELQLTSGATLVGNATIHADVVNAGTLAPGNSPGIVIVEGNYSQTGTLQIELQGTSAANPDFDQLFVQGAVALGGTLSVDLLGTYQPQLGDRYQIITNDGTDSITGTFAGLPEGAQFFVDQTAFQISYVGGTGNDVTLTVTRTPQIVTTTSDAAAGDLDVSFGAGTGRSFTSIGAQNDFTEAGTIQADGKLVIAGYTGASGAYDMFVARYLADGTLDTSFDGDGKLTTNQGPEDAITSIAVQPSDQKLVAAGWTGSGGSVYDFMTVRYTSTGALDTTFDGDGKRTDDFGGFSDFAYDMVIQPDGRIIVVGEMHTGFETNFALLRYLPNGSLDTSFGSGGKTNTNIILHDQAFSVALQPDGKILAAGRGIDGGGNQYVAVTRYLANGTLDTTFDGDGRVSFRLNGQNSYATSVLVLPSGRILLTTYTFLGGLGSVGLVRLNSDGSFDSTFDSDGVNVVTLSPTGLVPVRALAQPNGQILVAGYTHIGPNNNPLTMRFQSDGSLDLGYGQSGFAQNDLRGTADFVADAAFDSSGRAVLFGRSNNLSGTKYEAAVTRVAALGSLRQAIRDANALANINGVADSILFDIPGVGPHTITPATPLPAITDPVTIDGWSEPDYAGAPVIELNGQNAGVNNGLNVFASNSVIRGLAINRFGFSGITLNPGANNTTIAGNYIGVDITGTLDQGNVRYGIDITRAANNLVENNVISGNNDFGILINSPGTAEANGNIVRGNRIGTDASGALAVPNNGGIFIQRASNSQIGGSSPADRNIVSGNAAQGIIVRGPDANNNAVRGNYVGLNAAGSAALPNQFQAGVLIDNSANGTLVGGASAGEGNVISGNLGIGVLLSSGAHHSVIAGNLVGLDATGTTALGNSQEGVRLESSSHHNTIGGAATLARNVISGNGTAGIDLVSAGTSDNVVLGNYIGTDSSGLLDRGNAQDGIRIFGQATNNVVGGSTAAERNIISGNDSRGLIILNAGTSGNQVLGNYIGVDATGAGPLGNSQGGVFFFVDPSQNTIGGRGAGEGNVIASNVGPGVSMQSVAGFANAIIGNSIRANSGLGIDLGADGVTLNDGPDANDAQNFPVVAAVTDGLGRTLIQATLSSVASTSFTFDFFASATADPSGYGEGDRYLGSSTGSTDGAGQLGQAVALLVVTAPGEKLTATATRSGGGTSEFSQAVVIAANQAPTADAGGPYASFVGGGVTLDASGSFDPDSAVGDSVVSYEWDLDDDGQYDDWTSAAASSVAPWSVLNNLGLSVGAHTIRLRAVDSFGAAGTDAATLTIVPPILHWQGDVSATWSDAGNWLENIAPIDGTTLFFDSTTAGFANYASVNDLVDLEIESISISMSASFNLSGNAISLAHGLSTSGAVSTIGLAGITLQAPQTFDLAGAFTSVNSAIDLNGHDLTVTGHNNKSFAGVISGAGGLNIVDSWDTLLNAANTYSGPTLIDQSIVVLQLSGQLGSAAAGTTVVNSTLALSSGVVSADAVQLSGSVSTLRGRNSAIQAGPVQLATSSLALVENDSGTSVFTVSGPIAGTAGGSGLRFTGAAGRSIALSGANTYSGATRAIDVAIVSGAAEVLPNSTQLTLDANASLDLAGFAETIGSLTGAGSVALGAATLTLGGDGSSTTFSGPISGAGGLNKQGSGTFTLSGNSSYAGATAINAGTLVAASNNALGSAAGATTVSGTGLLSIAAGVNTAEPLVINSGRQAVLQDAAIASGSIQLAGTLAGRVSSQASGPITLAGPSAGFTMLSSPGTFIVSGAITDGPASYGISALTTSSSAVIRLSNPSNTYDGTTTITGVGALELGASQVVPDTSAVTIDAGATFRLAGFDETIESLAGAGDVDLGACTLTTGATSSTTFSGAISGLGGLVKRGSGQWTLTGASNFSGETVVQAGTLVVGSSAALGSASGSTMVTGSGLVSIADSISTAESFVVNSGHTLVLQENASATGAVQLAGVVSGRAGSVVSGPITLTGPSAGFTMLSAPGTFVVSGAIIDGPSSLGVTALTTSSLAILRFSNPSNTYDGPTFVTGPGALELGAAQVIPDSSPLTIDVGARLELAGYHESVASLANNGTIQLAGGSLTSLAAAASSGSIIQSGSLGATLFTNSGTLAPGATVGTIEVNGDFAQTNAGALAIDVGGISAGTQYDQLSVDGAVTLDGALTLNLINGFVPSLGDRFTLVANDGVDPVIGAFAGYPEGFAFTLAGVHATLTYSGGDGNDVELVANWPPVADAGGPYSIDLGDSVTLDASNSSDPDPGDSIVAYHWDLDHDLQFDDWSSATPTTTVPWLVLQNIGLLPGALPIAVRVVDESGASADASTTLNLSSLLTYDVVANGLDDEYTLRRSGSNLQFVAGPSTILVDYPTAAIASVEVRGAAGESEQLTIDYAFGGVFSTPVSFDGGAAGTDVLRVHGGSFVSTTYAVSTADAATLTLDSTTLAATGAERLDFAGTTEQLVLQLSSAADTAILSNSGGAADGESELSTSSGTAPVFRFATPAVAVTLDTSSGADAVSIAGIDAMFTGNLNLAGTTDDALAFDGPLTLGQVVGSAKSINFHASLNVFDLFLTAHTDVTIDAPLVAGGGGLDLIAGRSINVNANVTVNSGGALTLAANSGVNAGVQDALRDAGVAELTMASGVTVTNVSGGLLALLVESGNGLTNSTSGDLRLANVAAPSGHVLVRNQGPTAGSDIVAGSGLINSLSVALDAPGSTAAVGSLASPVVVTNGAGTPTVEARGGAGGVFVSSLADLAIGGADLGGLAGIATMGGGDVSATAVGSLTVVEPIVASGDVRLYSDGGSIGGVNGAGLDVAADELNVEAYLSIDLDTQIATLIARTGIAGNGGGALVIDEVDGLSASNVVVTGAGADASLSTAAGSIEVVTLTAPDVVTLSAIAGSILDGNGAGVANVAAPSLALSAATGITLDVVATTITSATTTTSGAGVAIRDLAGGLAVVAASTVDGPVTLRADGGTLTATAVSAGAGAVELRTATSGNLLVGSAVTSGSLTIVSAGSIDELGADPALDLAAGTLALSAVGPIGAAGVIELDAATLASAVAGAGSLTLIDSAGGLSVTGLVQAPLAVSLSTPETAATTDSLNFTPTAVVRSISSSVTLSVGDNMQLAAGGLVQSVSSSITLNLGAGNTDGLTSIAALDGQLQSPFTFNVVGGSGPDQLQFLANATLVQFPSFSWNGGTGVDRLTLSRALGTSFNVNTGGTSATNQGTTSTSGFGSGTFTAVESLVGGAGNDTFAFSASRSVSGLIDGAGGVDTLNYSGRTASVAIQLGTGAATATGGIANFETFVGSSNAADSLTGPNSVNSWNLTGVNIGTLNGAISYSAIENLTGGSDVDAFTLGPAGSLAGTVNGGAASDTLIGRDIANAWNVTAANAGNLNGSLNFAAIENLTGGSNADSFNFAGNTRSVSGVVTGGGGLDTLNYAGRTSAVSVDLQALSATATGGFVSIEALVGGSGSDTLIGPAAVNTWNLTSAGGGDLGGAFTYSAIENLTGGPDADRFQFAIGGSVTGTISGDGGSNDLLDYQALPTAVTINLQTMVATGAAAFAAIEAFLGSAASTDTLIGPNTINNWGLTQSNGGGLNASYSFAGIENLTGGSSSDTLTAGLGMSLSGAFNGGAGTDTIVGPNGFANQWTMSGSNAGNLNGLVTFSAVENVTGGSGNDQFLFAATGALTGVLDGAGGANELNYASYGAAVTVDLGAGSASGVAALVNVSNFVGSALAADLLIGEDFAQTWTISGVSSGSTSVGTVFSAFERLTGGSAEDRFELVAGGAIAGPIQGGAGTDTLAALNVSNVWNVTGDNAGNLNAALSFSSIEALAGGTSDDTFNFNNGAALASLVDGGLGADTLNYSAYVAALTINLEQGTFASGAETYGIAGVETLLGGGAATDQLVGPNNGSAWYLSGSNAGDLNGELAFSAFERLTGGNSSDDFVFDTGATVSGSIDGAGGFDTLDYTSYSTAIALNLATGAATGTGGFSNIESAIGGSAVDSLTGANVANAWSLSGVDEGAVNGFSFVSFENAAGGTSTDTFTIAAGASLSGSIHGGTGVDTLVAGPGFHAWNIPSANNAGTLDGQAFASIENLTGGGDADEFTLGAGRSVSGVIDGGGGGDTLNLAAYSTAVNVNLQTGAATGATGGVVAIENFVGGSAVDTFTGADSTAAWLVTGANEGTWNGAVAFQSFENLVGGAANDNFAFADGGSVSGALTGNGGTDVVDFSQATGPVTINLTASYASVESVVGSASSADTLIASNSVNLFSFTGANSGTLNGTLAFAAIENFTSGTSADSFVFGAGSSVGGVIAGGGGSDTFDYSAKSDAIAINLQTSAASLVGGFSSIENFVGGSGGDTLTGANAAQTWTISATNAGAVGGVSFAGIENLAGGTGVDTFNLSAGYLATGSIEGRSGVDVVVGANADATWTLGAAGGVTVVWSGLGTAQFAQIESLVGGTGADTLVGSDANTTWSLTGANQGTIVGGVSFVGMENLAGGAGADTFALATAASVSGGVSGGGGVNTLDYSARSSAVVVDLTLGAATSIGGAVANIRNVTAGAGNDKLVGDAQANVLIGNNGDDTLDGLGGDDTLQGGQGSNVLLGGDQNDTLTGGTGRDLLIGGNGADNLNGGGGDDILIGGRTTHDANPAALDAIMAEWRSGSSYPVRVDHLSGALPGGLNGSTLLTPATVLDDGAAPDVLTGAGGRDLFFALLGNDVVTDLNNGGPETLRGL